MTDRSTYWLLANAWLAFAFGLWLFNDLTFWRSDGLMMALLMGAVMAGVNLGVTLGTFVHRRPR